MVNTKKIIFILIIIATLFLLGTKLYATNNIEMQYEYDETNNIVEAKIVSDIELNDTKPTWILSKDRLTYTKKFTENTKYSTLVEDINGNETYVEINITDIKDWKLNIEYEYSSITNQVTARINSNVPIKHTKPTWVLSEDKLTYTKKFTENTKYSTLVENINGYKTYVEINVKDIQKWKLNVEYEYSNITNEVIAKIKSNIALKHTKPTWTLEEDKKTYIKKYIDNSSYVTRVESLSGEIRDIVININQIQKPRLKIEYEYDEEMNQVKVNITSETKLKHTKPTWKLSEDKMIYTKTFTENMKYSTLVEDTNGNTTYAEINVTGIKEWKLNVEYEYSNITNEVIAKIQSNISLKHTKPTWTLETGKKIYTKKYTENSIYSTTVESLGGETRDITIEINQIDTTPPQLTLEYMYNEDDTVTVYMRSNEQLGHTKPTWTLSEDKKTYQKTFEEDQNYSTLVQDRYGNGKNITIDFKKKHHTYSQEDNSTIKVRYLYIEHKKAIVEIKSSIEMQDTKPTWTLSKDQLTYTKTFTSNNIYETSIIDVKGTQKQVNIIVNMFDDYLLGIDVSHHNGDIDWQKVKASGIEFAIIRCGYGQNMTSQDDRKFLYNIEQCEKLGIPYGIYLYSYAANTKAASSEADHVLRLIKGHNPTFGVWLDLEEDEIIADFIDIAITFCEKIKLNGYNNVGIYANLNWWQNRLNDSRLNIYKKWIAQWGSSCDYKLAYTMWQYTSFGKIEGIPSERVDMNIYYK